MQAKRPDDVCESYYEKGVNLSLKKLEGEDAELILIEGDRQSLEFLAELIMAQARFTKDSGFQIFPNGPGGSFFAVGSMGIYIHRIDS